MRLASKIFLVSACAILLLGGVAAWSIVAVSRLAEVNRDIAMRAVPAIETASGLPESFRRLVRLEAKHLVLRDRAYADLWNERATRAASELDRLGTLLVTPDEIMWHRRTVAAFAAYRGHVEQARAHLARGEVERAQQISERPAREAAEQAETSVVKLTAASNGALGRAQADAATLAAQDVDGGGRRVPRRPRRRPRRHRPRRPPHDALPAAAVPRHPRSRGRRVHRRAARGPERRDR